jgi:type IV pilus assembly protein PilE
MHTWNRGGRRAARGVTLIELLVVIVVLAILGSLAVSSYRRYMLRSNRTDATTTLLRIQVAQEKFFLQNNRYADSGELTTAPPAGLGLALGSGGLTTNGFYTIALDSPDATHYTATATATAGQTADVAACQTFTINEQGQRTPAESSGCWK